MADYWIDTNIFITAKNGPYAFDLAPAFWKFLDDQASEEAIRSSRFVYEELIHEEDDLSKWAKERKSNGLFVEPDEVVQKSLNEIADYVSANFPDPEVARFLTGADPWIIAQARVHGGQVVTFEGLATPNSKRIKIPNICVKFGVGYCNLYTMLRALGFKV